MTSIAVTASVCASASEAAFLVASFMPNSLDLGMSHPCPRRPDELSLVYSEHPATSIRSFESPLSEYRQSENRPALRRQFGSRVAGLCTREGVFWSASSAPEPAEMPLGPSF